MNKLFVIGPLILLSTTKVYGWQIGPIKGDDPRIIVDVVEGVKKAGTEVSNGVRDVIGAVGNATGLTDVVETNAKTFSELGRANACLMTLCASERARADQIQKAELEAREKYETAKAEQITKYHQTNRGTQKKMLENSATLAMAMRLQLAKSSTMLDLAIDNIRALKKAIIVEKEFRKKLKQHNIERRPLEKTEMISTSQQFQNTQKQNINLAIDRLNSDIEALSIATGRSQAVLLAEFIRCIDEGTVEDLEKHADTRLAQLNEERATNGRSMLEIDAELQSITQKLNSGNY